MQVSISELNRCQDDFQRILSSYIDGSCFTNLQRLLWNPLTSASYCRRHAPDVIQSFREYNASVERTCGGDWASIDVDPYRGQNRHVADLASFLHARLDEDLIGAYVHGSLGTGEEIAYSDFDALLIFKDSIFESVEKLASIAEQVIFARTFLWNYDSLQHHSFFVLTETDLGWYPDNVFPRVLFPYAKSLLATGRRLKVRIHDERFSDAKPLAAILDAIEKKLTTGIRPRTAFELKLLLSQVMLLPCLVLQALGRPVFKRQSFELARVLYEQEQWRAIQTASRLRSNWPDRTSTPLRWLTDAVSHPFWRMILERKLGTAIDTSLQCDLNEQFYRDILAFVKASRSIVPELRQKIS